MADLKNEFSWSWSRHRAFDSCLRRYYLQHYAFWGGWEPDSPNREVYIQKKLNSRPMWIGTTVHAAAEWVLGQVRRGHYPPPDRVVERFLRGARRAIDESARGLYRFRPKRSPGFVDHYYGLETPDEAWQADLEEIERQIRGLFTNKVFQRLARVPGRIIEVERLEQVEVGGVPVWVSLDVLVSDGAGGYVIIDWKTGREHDAETVAAQLGVYGAYVLDRYLDQRPHTAGDDHVGRIQAMYVNLRSDTFETRPIDREVLERTVRTVQDSASAMRERLEDATENIAREGDFPMVEEGSPACRWCVFRRTCGRE